VSAQGRGSGIVGQEGKDQVIRLVGEDTQNGSWMGTLWVSVFSLRMQQNPKPWTLGTVWFAGFLGGSADLAPSNMTLMKAFGDFQKGTYAERNLRFGVREHGMGAICNGLALHNSGLIPYCATFFIFTGAAGFSRSQRRHMY
jgi:hypothetical protein